MFKFAVAVGTYHQALVYLSLNHVSTCTLADESRHIVLLFLWLCMVVVQTPGIAFAAVMATPLRLILSGPFLVNPSHGPVVLLRVPHDRLPFCRK